MQREKILQKIDEYLDGKLSTREIEELWVEILDQPEYVSYLNTLVNINYILKNRKKPISFWKKNRNWISGIAALLAIFISFFLIKLNSGGIEFNAVDQIPSSEMESPAATRSVNQHFSTADSLLNLGYMEASDGHISKAISSFNELALQAGENTNVAKAFFNIGVLHYNSENYQKAETSFVDALDNIKNDDILKEKTSWYLGNTYVKMGEFRQAQKTLKNVIGMNGIYKDRATELLGDVDQKLPKH